MKYSKTKKMLQENKKMNCKLLRSKKGSEFVEAAISMQLIILISIAIVLLCMHFYRCLDIQVRMHGELNDLSATNENIYSEASKNEIIGISEITANKILLDESKIIRAGEVITW